MNVDLSIRRAIKTAKAIRKIFDCSVIVCVRTSIVREECGDWRDSEFLPEQIDFIEEEYDRLGVEPFAIDEGFK